MPPGYRPADDDDAADAGALDAIEQGNMGFLDENSGILRRMAAQTGAVGADNRIATADDSCRLLRIGDIRLQHREAFGRLQL